jgi:hypothetical protein
MLVLHPVESLLTHFPICINTLFFLIYYKKFLNLKFKLPSVADEVASFRSYPVGQAVHLEESLFKLHVVQLE